MMLMNSKVYQLKVTVRGTKPAIWRRVYVPDTVSLIDLHKIIQTLMGWYNSYSYYFEAGDAAFGIPDPDVDDLRIDIRGVSLRQVLRRERGVLHYHYDPEDRWDVEIELEKVLSRNISFKKPVCSEGEMSGPPEDCGGVEGYRDLVRVLADSSDEKFYEYSEWVGKEFKPEFFDQDLINAYLSATDFGTPDDDSDYVYLEDDIAFDIEPV